MRLRRTVCCSVVGTLLFACSARSIRAETQLEAAELSPAAAYYPLEVGNSWQFEMSVGDAKQPFEYRVAKLETIDSIPMFRIDTVIAGNVVASENLGANEKGLFRYRYSGIEIDPPIALLRNPVRVGDSWSLTTKIGGQEVMVTCQVARQTITVAAGKFDAIRLLVKTKVDGVDISGEYWFAANTGIVRQSLTVGGKPVSMELQKFVAPDR